MNPEHRERKQAIRNFMQNHYSDQRLVDLLAWAKDGKLEYLSCCCFIGIATADHALQNDIYFERPSHYYISKQLLGAAEAEWAFLNFGNDRNTNDNNAKRRRILIPIIRAEMKRRDAARKRIEWKQELVEMST